jgi:hypothetical protein
MEAKRVNAEDVKRVLAADVERLAEEITAAMNAAKPGRIIADSEEPFRDACAEFRRQAYEKALGLLQEQGAFSPSGERAAEQGQAEDHVPDGQRANRSS